MQKAHSTNCNSTNNIFSIDRFTSVVGGANANGSCEIILLAGAKSYLPAIEFRSFEPSSNDTFIVSSPINQETYFETNSIDTENWRYATIYNPVLTITVPSNQNIYALANIPATPVIVYLSRTTNYSIFTSPTYGGYDIEPMSDPTTLYNLTVVSYGYDTYNIELNVKSMDGNGTVFCYNKDQNLNIEIQPNETLSQNGTNFQIIYQSFENFNFFIEYSVTRIIATTTTRTTTTPKTTTTTQISTTNVTLNYANPYYVFWLDNLQDNGYLTVCTEDHDTLELFVTSGNNLDTYNLYDHNGFYNFVGSNTDASNWRNIAIYTNALSISFTSTVSVTLFNSYPKLVKDEKHYQRGIMVSPSHTGFSTKLNGSNLLYQLNNYGGTTNKMAINFTVKNLDKNCVVTVKNSDTQQNH
uniref:Uncharacterized protein n=1 Tax=Panagrolaimus sp. ES5 TaxID=591445 RepID=A0AC34FX40_9BILA